MPILCSGAFPMLGLIHSFNKYGRPASLYDSFWSPVWVLYSVLWLPNRYRRNPLPWLRVAEPLPHPAAVAASSRTAAAEPLLPNCCCRRTAAAARLPAKRGRRYLPPLPTTAPTAAPRTAAAEPLPPKRGRRYLPPQPAAVASSSRTAAAPSRRGSE